MKKKFNKLAERIITILIALLPILLTITILAIATYVSYKISASDLPDWFKFWLLM